MSSIYQPYRAMTLELNSSIRIGRKIANIWAEIEKRLLYVLLAQYTIA